MTRQLAQSPEDCYTYGKRRPRPDDARSWSSDGLWMKTDWDFLHIRVDKWERIWYPKYMNNRSYENMNIRKGNGMREFLHNEEQLIDMAELFKVFGDSTRIKILCHLFDGERYVQEIADLVGASQSAVSHQLKILKQAKLVKSRRQGKLVGYSLADDHVKTILGMAKDHLEE